MSAVAESIADETDEALMKRIGAGEPRAFREMSARHLERIARFATRMLGSQSEAEDVVQETFLRLWTGAAQFEPHAKPSTWLFRIARNLCIDRIRKRREVGSDALDRHSSGDRPAEQLDRKEAARQVNAALALLPERQRAALTLVHYEGMSDAEAAQVLEVSVDALESLLARGRRTLRETLRELAEGSTEATRDGGPT